jgi:hypothetical protein
MTQRRATPRRRDATLGVRGLRRTAMPTVTDVQDRTLAITATPTLNWSGNSATGWFLSSITMAYSQTGSNPTMNGVVNSGNGNINLHNMPPNSSFTDNVDITFTLDTSQCKDPNGNSIGVRWAQTSEGNGPIWFCATPPPHQPKNTNPITVSGMTLGRTSDTVIYLDDDQGDNGSSYTFCLGVTVPSVSNVPFTIDPVISGKGQNTNSFMLSE